MVYRAAQLRMRDVLLLQSCCSVFIIDTRGTKYFFKTHIIYIYAEGEFCKKKSPHYTYSIITTKRKKQPCLSLSCYTKDITARAVHAREELKIAKSLTSPFIRNVLI